MRDTSLLLLAMSCLAGALCAHIPTSAPMAVLWNREVDVQRINRLAGNMWNAAVYDGVERPYLGVLSGGLSGKSTGGDPNSHGSLPDVFDWRNVSSSCIGPIRDQGKCGSCWAMSAVEVCTLLSTFRTWWSVLIEDGLGTFG